MKAARLQAYGDVDQFKLEDVPDPVAGPGTVLIEIAASGLNPVDLFVRQGYLAQYVPLEFPAILGVDAAGTILGVGPDVTDFAVGDRVVAHLPLNGHGSYAELAVVPVAGLARLPANVSFEAGATLPLAALTGQQAVDALGVKPGDRVLVAGALGSVGRAAVQYLKEQGARPVAGVRADRLREGEALAGEALDIDQVPTAPGFDLAVGTAGPVMVSTIKHVRDGGTLASVVSIPEGANDDGRVNIANISSHDDPAMLNRAVGAVARSELTIPVAATFKLSELAAAHTALAAGPRGKILLVS